MNIFSKIFSALKGGATEMGEAVVDANAIRIFEQELRDAKSELNKARESEISLLANKKRAEAKSTMLDEQITEYENHARAALKKGDESLALETAQRVAELQGEKVENQAKAQGLTKNCEKIRQQITKAESQITEMENNLSQIKATDSVHKTQQNIHANIIAGTSSVASAKESLKRIKERQEDFEARQEAADELNDQASLDKKLESAGIKKSGASAQDILAKLKAEKT